MSFLFASQLAVSTTEVSEVANNLDLTSEGLSAYEGLSIEDICELGFGDCGDTQNHCAHFVGHVLALNHATNVGLTCAQMTHGGRKQPASGACIRVNEVFNRQSQLAEADEKGCLVYITMKSNVTGEGEARVMGQQARKHIGIYLDGNVWHYGNTRDAVKRQTLADFKKHYSGDTIVLYTQFPKGAVFVSPE